MLTPIGPHNYPPFFQSEPTASENDSARNGSVPLPTCALDNEDFFSLSLSLPLAGECAEYNPSPVWLLQPGFLHRPCLHINAASELPSPMADQLPYGPGFPPITSHHVSERRSRLTTAGFHSRRREDFAWSHFFPRSVGFGPTVSKARGAFTTAPSMLCHDHTIPSISSYSTNPFHQRQKNTSVR